MGLTNSVIFLSVLGGRAFGALFFETDRKGVVLGSFFFFPISRGGAEGMPFFGNRLNSKEIHSNLG